MQLWNIKNSKAIFVCMMAIFLMAMLPFAMAHSLGDTISASPPLAPVSIDGVWSAGEWDDAVQYAMADPTAGNIGYIRAKYNSSHLLVIIDSIWDITPSVVYPMENTWIAIDTAHDGAWGAPQWDDYLFHIGGTTAWQGNTSSWAFTWVPFAGMQCSSDWGPGLLPSPNSGTPHRIDEMAIPLTHVGPAGSTVGFYALVEDDSTDPDGMGWLPATAYSEWPSVAGGSPGWPSGWGSAPTPAPVAWGDLTLQLRAQPVGGESVPIIVELAESGLLAPLIGIAALITLVAVSIVYVNHKKKK